MSGIGFSELIILFVIGLIVLGPERLPRVASQIGSWLGQARRMTRVMKRQLDEELNFEKEFSIAPSTHVPNEDDTFSPAHEVDDDVAGLTAAPPSVMAEQSTDDEAETAELSKEESEKTA